MQSDLLITEYWKPILKLVKINQMSLKKLIHMQQIHHIMSVKADLTTSTELKILHIF